jgi:hypothetical protein
MKHLLIFLFTSTLLSSSCLKNDSEKRNFEYFNKHLKKDMKFIDIKQRFGEPDEDKGSGIHIYVYKMKDSSTIWIGYTDKILYARHMDGNQQVIHTIF